jgi:hypothetical protein
VVLAGRDQRLVEVRGHQDGVEAADVVDLHVGTNPIATFETQLLHTSAGYGSKCGVKWLSCTAK